VVGKRQDRCDAFPCHQRAMCTSKRTYMLLTPSLTLHLTDWYKAHVIECVCVRVCVCVPVLAHACAHACACEGQGKQNLQRLRSAFMRLK
jgi:hypothetical protein